MGNISKITGYLQAASNTGKTDKYSAVELVGAATKARDAGDTDIAELFEDIINDLPLGGTKYKAISDRGDILVSKIKEVAKLTGPADIFDKNDLQTAVRNLAKADPQLPKNRKISPSVTSPTTSPSTTTSRTRPPIQTVTNTPTPVIDFAKEGYKQGKKKF